MSRTDVHRPWPVQVTDPHNRHLLYRYPAWPNRVEWTSWRNLMCGCAQCTGRDWQRFTAGRDRARWRAWRDEARKATDRGDLDYVPQHRKAW